MPKYPRPLDYYIKDEEKAVEEYYQLGLSLEKFGRPDLAVVVFGIMEDEDQHRKTLKMIQEAILKNGKL